MPGFAARTSVAPEKTRMEIERLLRTNGAIGFGYAWGEKGDQVMFQWRSHRLKFELPLVVKARSVSHREQLNRQRWRALFLVIKAKLEAVNSGISIFEEEFLANIVTQDGSTVGEHLVPRLQSGGQLALPPATGAS
jgi:hypothetical protein